MGQGTIVSRRLPPFHFNDASHDRREPRDRASSRDRRGPLRNCGSPSRNRSGPSRNRSSDRYQKRSVSPQKRAAKKEAKPAQSDSPFPRFNQEELIHLLKIADVIRHFGLDPPRRFPDELTDTIQVSPPHPRGTEDVGQLLVGRSHTSHRNQPQIRVHAERQVQLQLRTWILHTQQACAVCQPLVL
jgi:hypothetical protein